ncbi:MAG: type II toxin-antitoxin system RelE/ParE family toxin [Vicinamibacterales bacterium]|nr:type II toxin-antitoxin system RelE/ParE family toxin [Vicinamibacterales bacterium]
MAHRLSPEAESDLDAAWYYTATESGNADIADRLIEAITSRFLLLQTHPQIGRKLQLAAEGGLLLGIPIVLTIVAFAWEVRRRFREDVGSIWWIRLGAVIGLVAIALQSIAEFSLQMPGNAALFAVVAGLAIHDGRRVS